MIEQLLKQHLLENGGELQQYLATYDNKMAIFHLEAPADDDAKWNIADHYGRLVFTAALERSRERNISGTLFVDVIDKKGSTNLSEIESKVRPLIDGWFFNTSEGTVSAYWKTSVYSAEQDQDTSKTTLTFELYTYPVQKTTGPDPIALLNKWTKEDLAVNVLKQEMYVIGSDELPQTFKPSADKPAIYWRLSKTVKCNWIPDTRACSWQTAVIRGHIMTPGSEDAAIFIARVIDNSLSLKKRLLFDDQSPLMVDRNIRIERNVRLQRSGQITVDATYGVLDPPGNAEVLNKINIKER